MPPYHRSPCASSPSVSFANSTAPAASSRFTTVDMDFVRQYRPRTNVVERPTQRDGRGIALVGHHEILVPLLLAGLIEAVEAKAR